MNLTNLAQVMKLTVPLAFDGYTECNDCMQDMKITSIHVFTPIMRQKSAKIQYLMTQYGLQAGLIKFRKKGEEATMKELSQLHSLDIFTTLDAC